VEIDLPKVTIWKGVSNAFSLLPDCTFGWPSWPSGNDDKTFNPFIGKRLARLNPVSPEAGL